MTRHFDRGTHHESRLLVGAFFLSVDYASKLFVDSDSKVGSSRKWLRSMSEEKIRVQCPSCQKRLTAPRKLLGRTAKCPGCGNPIPIVEKVDKPRAIAEPGPPPRASEPETASKTTESPDETPETKRRRLASPLTLLGGGVGLTCLVAALFIFLASPPKVQKQSGEQVVKVDEGLAAEASVPQETASRENALQELTAASPPEVVADVLETVKQAPEPEPDPLYPLLVSIMKQVPESVAPSVKHSIVKEKRAREWFSDRFDGQLVYLDLSGPCRLELAADGSYIAHVLGSSINSAEHELSEQINSPALAGPGKLTYSVGCNFLGWETSYGSPRLAGADVSLKITDDGVAERLEGSEVCRVGLIAKIQKTDIQHENTDITGDVAINPGALFKVNLDLLILNIELLDESGPITQVKEAENAPAVFGENEQRVVGLVDLPAADQVLAATQPGNLFVWNTSQGQLVKQLSNGILDENGEVRDTKGKVRSPRPIPIEEIEFVDSFPDGQSFTMQGSFRQERKSRSLWFLYNANDLRQLALPERRDDYSAEIDRAIKRHISSLDPKDRSGYYRGLGLGMSKSDDDSIDRRIGVGFYGAGSTGGLLLRSFDGRKFVSWDNGVISIGVFEPSPKVFHVWPGKDISGDPYGYASMTTHVPRMVPAVFFQRFEVCCCHEWAVSPYFGRGQHDRGVQVRYAARCGGPRH